MLVILLLLGMTVFSLFVTKASAATGINHQINFQGKLVNTDGTNVTDGTYSIVFSLYTVSSGGSNIWTETQSSVSLSNGIFQVNLGSVTTLPGSVDFDTDNLYLGIKVGADAEMTPRVQFTAVPQAFNSEKLGGLDKTGFIQNQTASPQVASFNLSGSGQIATTAIGNKALVLQGFSGQTADLLQLQDNNGLINGAFNSTGAQLTLGRIAASGVVTQGKLILSDGTTDNFGLTLQSSTLTANRTYNFPNSTASTDTVCLLTLANCGSGGSGVTTVGTYSTSNTAAGGATIATTTITFQDASASAPGMVGTGAQTFAGNKTFSGSTTLGVPGTSVGTLTFSTSAANSRTTILQAANPSGAGNATVNIPTVAGGSSDTVCLVTLANCGGGASTLQGAYTGDADGGDAVINLTSTDGGILIRDASSPIGTTLFAVQTNGGSANFLGVSASAVTLQDASGNNALVFDSTTSHLKVYANTTSPTKYVDIYYDDTTNQGIIAASTGTTRVGSGSGNVTVPLTGVTDAFAFTKTYTPSAAYSTNEFTISRILTGTANSVTGAVLKVQDQTSGSAVASDLLILNQTNVATTGGSLFDAQLNGTSIFKVTPTAVTVSNNSTFLQSGTGTFGTGSGNVSLNGNTTLAAGKSLTGATTLTLASTTTSAVSLDSGTTGDVNIGGGANNKAIYIGAAGSTNAASTIHIADTSANQTQAVTIGNSANSSSTITLQSGATKETIANAGVAIQTTANSNTAFQVQNAVATPVLLVDTTSQDNNGSTLNYLSYASFESGSFSNAAAGWDKSGAVGASITQNSTKKHAFTGNYSVTATTTAASGDGLHTSSFISTPAANKYYVSFYAKVSTGTMTGDKFTVTTTDGATNPTCTGAAGTTINASGFQRISCTITTGGNMTDLKITQNDTVARTLYLDAIQLQTDDFNGGTNNITAPSLFNAGSLQLSGPLTSPLSILTNSDSSEALKVVSSSNIANLTVDTLNNYIQIGSATTDANAVLLILDSYNTTDPAGVNGAMYYSTNTNKFRCYENGAWSDCVGYRHLITLASDSTSTASVACQNVTGATFAVTAGNTYHYHATILHTASAATIGVSYGASIPASPTLFALSFASNLSTQVSAGGGQSVISTCTTPTGSSLATTGTVDTVDGVFVPSSSGTFQLLFAPETATAGGTVVKTGSTLEWW